MRQRIRKGIILVSLLLFPITLNFFSPYVSIDGAMAGVLSGSMLVFLLQFATATVLGRAWCGWLCPVAGLSEAATGVNGRPVKLSTLRRVRYAIFTAWAGVLVTMFILAGGIRGLDPLRLTETGFSVDEPIKYVTYYSVLMIFVVLSFALGRRGACQSICWMAPFMAGGYQIGRLLRLPQLRIRSRKGACINCGACDRKCPMSLPVGQLAKSGLVAVSDCILCGECVDGCRSQALAYGFGRCGQSRTTVERTDVKIYRKGDMRT